VVARPIDVERLRYDEKESGVNGQKSESSRGQVGGVSGGSRGVPELIKTGLGNGFRAKPPKSTDTGDGEEAASIVTVAIGGRR
jgi:hypothetical protein